MTWIGSSVRHASSGATSLRNGRLKAKKRPWSGCSQSIASKTTCPSRRRSKTTAAVSRCCGTRARTSRAISRGSRCRISVSPSRVLTIAPLLRMSVSGAGQLFEDRPREVVAAPGGERHLDAGLDGPCDRVAVRGRDPSPAVEDGAIYVKGEEANRQELATGKGEKDIVLAAIPFPCGRQLCREQRPSRTGRGAPRRSDA